MPGRSEAPRPVFNPPPPPQVIVRAGVQFIATADTSATVSGFLTEGATAGAEVPFAMSFSVSAVYNYGNVSSVGFNLELLDNSTTWVTPGLRLPVGVAFTLPADITVPVEVGVRSAWARAGVKSAAVCFLLVFLFTFNPKN